MPARYCGRSAATAASWKASTAATASTPIPTSATEPMVAARRGKPRRRSWRTRGAITRLRIKARVSGSSTCCPKCIRATKQVAGNSQPVGSRWRDSLSSMLSAAQLRTGTMLKRVTSSDRASSCASSAGEVERERSSATTLKRHSGWLSLNETLKLSRNTR